MVGIKVNQKAVGKQLEEYFDMQRAKRRKDVVWVGYTKEEDERSLDVADIMHKELNTIEFAIDWLENPTAEASDKEIEEHVAVLEEMKKIRKTALAFESGKKW